VAIPYNSASVRSYVKGGLRRARLNPFAVDGGPHDGGLDGADLYVGAELVPGYGIANCDRGLLGGLAVYDRTLPGDELAKLAMRASIVPA